MITMDLCARVGWRGSCGSHHDQQASRMTGDECARVGGRGSYGTLHQRASRMTGWDQLVLVWSRGIRYRSLFEQASGRSSSHVIVIVNHSGAMNTSTGSRSGDKEAQLSRQKWGVICVHDGGHEEYKNDHRDSVYLKHFCKLQVVDSHVEVIYTYVYN
ncbi:hypothetical protein CIPAW_03G260600 [Carya illinoinensis]|uniref:Uncharacterized protein n=1 Tax=Carya illinoinensis TaxID=32201 RepID=A0A8T1R6B7_CARIL|nr:hypothetical protein CIPAW_03G260600 [Carya illinoinensis]